MIRSSIPLVVKFEGAEVPSSGVPLYHINRAPSSPTTKAMLNVPFIQRVRFVFQITQSPKKVFQKTILSLKFEIPAHISKQLTV